MNRTTLIGLSAAALFVLTGETAVASVMLTEDYYPPQTFASFNYLANFYYQPIELTLADPVVVVGELIPFEEGTIELQSQELLPPDPQNPVSEVVLSDPGYIDPTFESSGAITMAFSGGVINYFSLAPAAFDVTVQAVPVPAAVWLFGSALAGFAAFGKRRQKR
jgi:hypothetical protein